MRIVLVVIGIILVAGGIWVVAGHGSYSHTETVARIGSVQMQASQQRPVPEWLGIAGIVVGGILLISGAATRGKK